MGWQQRHIFHFFLTSCRGWCDLALKWNPMTNSRNPSLMHLHKAASFHSIFCMHIGNWKSQANLSLYAVTLFSLAWWIRREGYQEGEPGGHGQPLWSLCVSRGGVAQGAGPIWVTSLPHWMLPSSSHLANQHSWSSNHQQLGYRHKPGMISSSLPPQPSTERRFLAVSLPSCVLRNQEGPGHDTALLACASRTLMWNGFGAHKLILWLTIRRFHTVLPDIFKMSLSYVSIKLKICCVLCRQYLCTVLGSGQWLMCITHPAAMCS